MLKNKILDIKIRRNRTISKTYKEFHTIVHAI